MAGLIGPHKKSPDDLPLLPRHTSRDALRHPERACLCFARVGRVDVGVSSGDHSLEDKPDGLPVGGGRPAYVTIPQP